MDLFHHRQFNIHFSFSENKYKYFTRKCLRPERLKAHLHIWVDYGHVICKPGQSVSSIASEHKMRPLQVDHASQRLPFRQFGWFIVEVLIVLHIFLIKDYWFRLVEGAIWNVNSFKTKSFTWHYCWQNWIWHMDKRLNEKPLNDLKNWKL